MWEGNYLSMSPFHLPLIAEKLTLRCGSATKKKITLKIVAC